MRKVGSVKITSKTWDETTKKNKVILVKLCTRICAHCLEIKKDWDKLSSMYDGHEVILVGEVGTYIIMTYANYAPVVML